MGQDGVGLGGRALEEEGTVGLLTKWCVPPSLASRALGACLGTQWASSAGGAGRRWSWCREDSLQ